MYEHYFATKIKNFYLKYIKIERDNEEFYYLKSKQNVILKNGKVKEKLVKKKVFKPIDPLYRSPFQEKYLIRLREGNSRVSIYNFNIVTLIKWINYSKRWINPLTNCPFKNSSRKKIIRFYETNKIPVKLRIKYEKNIQENFNLDQPTFEKKIIKYLNNNDTYRLVKLYSNTQKKLMEKTLSLDFKVPCKIYNEITKEYFLELHLIHYFIIKGKTSIFKMFLNYFENLEVETIPGNFKPIHLCALNNEKKMGKLLVKQQVDIHSKCLFEKEEKDIFEICDIFNNQEFINFIFNQ